MFVTMFYSDIRVDTLKPCVPRHKNNTSHCSHSGYWIPGFPTRDTWRRTEETPPIFYGRAIHYAPGIMWTTAIKRGFDEDYLESFDCLVSGFFINDVGRVAWVLFEGRTYECLVVDNARPRDLYETVIFNREVMEVEYTFAKDVLGNTVVGAPNPIVVVAYQIEQPTLGEWASAERLDKYLKDNWVMSYHGEPNGHIQLKADQEAWYLMSGDDEIWTMIPGCKYCNDDMKFGFIEGEYDLYYVEHGDSLDKISKKMYGYSHPRFWRAIFIANEDRMKDEYFIGVGMQLKIPVWKEFEIEQGPPN